MMPMSARPTPRARFVLLTCIFFFEAAAAALAPAARAEINALISKLEASACEFNRNGTWYTAADAKSHLLRKLKYLEDRGALQSAEQFIELAASNSSLSGRPYLVKCGDDPPLGSGKWLRSQLQIIRSDGKAPPSSSSDKRY
jgi:hypothetical protein